MRFFAFIFLQCFVLVLQANPLEIIFWHSLAGSLGTTVNQLANDFNRSQPNYRIKPIYKGEYSESLTSFAAAFRAKQPPAIIQVFEVGTPVLLYPKGIIKPVDDLMQEYGLNLPKKDFLPALRDFYSESGKLLALPFNNSIPVIFYNADVLARLGYSEKTFPKTWNELEKLASIIHQSGFPCAYTTAYPAWIHIESFAAIHGISLRDRNTQISYDDTAILNHLKRLKRWQNNHFFEYGGRANNATVLFTSGRCPLFSQSSGSYTSLASLVNFRLGVAPLPLDTGASRKRSNDVIGGAALWVVAGQSANTYRGVASFLYYLAQPEVQQRWHHQTGYLPLGIDGVYGHQGEGKNPILTIAQFDLARQAIAMNHYRSPQNLIRTINDEALESIFANIFTPEQAMKEAVRRRNWALKRFTTNTGGY